MGLTSILRGFSAMLFVVGVLMLAPTLLAYANQEIYAGSYLFGAVATLITSGVAFMASIGQRPSSDFRGALIIILLWWAVVPVFAALPFMLGPMSFSDAYFESVSAMTTTGGWLSMTTVFESQAGILWRALLQWIGGLGSLAIAAAIFIRPAFIGIDTLLPPFSRGERNSYLRSLA